MWSRGGKLCSEFISYFCGVFSVLTLPQERGVDVDGVWGGSHHCHAVLGGYRTEDEQQD
jgi:hypothetical protein